MAWQNAADGGDAAQDEATRAVGCGGMPDGVGTQDREVLERGGIRQAGVQRDTPAEQSPRPVIRTVRLRQGTRSAEVSLKALVAAVRPRWPMGVDP
ncbi:hypothetical protein [Streptomyces spinosus]|uniref:hypothetical protein n=1 Tax=Streptomyces spinosus TaxID=2872623 RepID=UPI001CED201A|nr:hypothetical protein [Streptomyces spinosus]